MTCRSKNAPAENVEPEMGFDLYVATLTVIRPLPGVLLAVVTLMPAPPGAVGTPKVAVEPGSPQKVAACSTVEPTIRIEMATETRPPGLATVAHARAASRVVAPSDAGMAARSSVGPAYVVARGAPFHDTTGPATNPVPETWSVKAGPPAGTCLGVVESTAGVGEGSGVCCSKAP